MPVSRIFAAALAVATVAGCAATQPTSKPNTGLGGVTYMPMRPSVFVRAAYDSDASNLIGAFIPDELDDAEIDESQAARTRCSRFIGAAEVPATGEVEDVFAASASLGGSIGVKKVVAFKGEHKETNALRIRYNATRKLQARVDEDGLAKCCAAAPEQCSKRYISSAVAGDGRIFVATERGNEAGLEASGSLKNLPIDADVMYRDGVKWERTTSFANQYFAFGVQRTAVGKARDVAADCSWTKRAPNSLDGVFFIGVSEPRLTEVEARESAMDQSGRQAMRFVGEWLGEESETNQSFAGALSAISGEMQQTRTQERISKAMVRLLKHQSFCETERTRTPDGDRRVLNVLSYLPNSEVKNASRIQITSIMEALRERGQLSASQEKAFHAALAELGGEPSSANTATAGGRTVETQRATMPAASGTTGQVNSAGGAPADPKAGNGTIPDFSPSAKEKKDEEKKDKTAVEQIVDTAVNAGQQLLEDHGKNSKNEEKKDSRGGDKGEDKGKGEKKDK